MTKAIMISINPELNQMTKDLVDGYSAEVSGHECKHGKCVVITFSLNDKTPESIIENLVSTVCQLDPSILFLGVMKQTDKCDTFSFDTETFEMMTEPQMFYAKSVLSTVLHVPMFLFNPNAKVMDVIRPHHKWSQDKERTWLRTKLKDGKHRSGYLENMLRRAPRR
jgi:hypothetical protein